MVIKEQGVEELYQPVLHLGGRGFSGVTLLLHTLRMRSSSRKGTSAARLMASSSVLLKPVTCTKDLKRKTLFGSLISTFYCCLRLSLDQAAAHSVSISRCTQWWSWPFIAALSVKKTASFRVAFFFRAGCRWRRPAAGHCH